MRAFAGKMQVGFECVPATVEHSLLRLPFSGDRSGVRLVIDDGAGKDLFAPLPGGGPVLAFPVPNQLLARPDINFRLLVGATLQDLPDPVRRHPLAESARAQAEIAALGSEVDRLTGRLASHEERTARLARRHAALIASVRRSSGARLAAAPAASGLAVAAVLAAVVAAALLGAVPRPGAEGAGASARPPAATDLPAAARPAAPVPPPTGAHADIPAEFVARYREAGRRYLLDWHVLAAVGKLETDHGRWLDNPSGAAGPAQFLGATWQRYGFDGDTDGRADVYDPDDAIPAMASYLRASGAPQDWPAALYAYNHSREYVREVLRIAGRYRAWRPR